MKTCILLLSLFGSLLADDPKPMFRWLSERSSSGIQHLAIKMGNVEHTVVLHPYNPFSFEFGAQEACIFKGQMMMDSNVEVLVTGGCPGADSFDIAMVGNGMEGFRYNVRNGDARKLTNPIGTVIPSLQFQPQYNVTLNRAALPTQGFVYKIAIIYDKNWKAKFVTDAESVNAVGRAVAQAQIIFKWPSLTVPITLNVASVTFQNIDIPSDGAGLDALIPFVTDDTINSYVGLTNIGSSGGIAYQPGVCGPKQYRTSIIKSYDDKTTGEIICHELGHNLGMTHDFIDPYTSPKTILRDAKGVSCTDSNGVMDYYVTVQKWTTCSVEGFTQHYNNIVAQAGSFCMALAGPVTPVNGNWGAWSAWGTCSKTCGSGSQTRTRQCNNPAPSNGGATCAGSSSASQTCNTLTCPATSAVALVGGTSSNQGYLYATNPVTKIYGPVCDDYFTLSAAAVVCKQLGFPSAQSQTCCSAKGAVPTNFSYDDVKCVGTEKTLDACPHLNTHDCYSNEGVWIVCNLASG